MNIQLWSVADYTKKDFFGTLTELARMGYTGVEFAGYFGISKEDMKKKLDELGLVAISSHVGYDGLKNNLEGEIEYLTYLGAKYIVCPGAEVRTVSEAKAIAPFFNEVGKKAKEAGLIFGYHNHDFEFVVDDGQYPLTVMFDNTDPELVKMQPDLYWVAYAGIDPIKYLADNLDRCPTIHLKQIKDMESKENVNAGSGVIDFKKAMEMAPNADFIYEQEQYNGTSMEEVERSINYFKGV